jgi:hypothetical protein
VNLLSSGHGRVRQHLETKAQGNSRQGKAKTGVEGQRWRYYDFRGFALHVLSVSAIYASLKSLCYLCHQHPKGMQEVSLWAMHGMM